MIENYQYYTTFQNVTVPEESQKIKIPLFELTVTADEEQVIDKKTFLFLVERHLIDSFQERLSSTNMNLVDISLSYSDLIDRKLFMTVDKIMDNDDSNEKTEDVIDEIIEEIHQDMDGTKEMNSTNIEHQFDKIEEAFDLSTIQHPFFFQGLAFINATTPASSPVQLLEEHDNVVKPDFIHSTFNDRSLKELKGDMQKYNMKVISINFVFVDHTTTDSNILGPSIDRQSLFLVTLSSVVLLCTVGIASFALYKKKSLSTSNSKKKSTIDIVSNDLFEDDSMENSVSSTIAGIEAQDAQTIKYAQSEDGSSVSSNSYGFSLQGHDICSSNNDDLESICTKVDSILLGFDEEDEQVATLSVTTAPLPRRHMYESTSQNIIGISRSEGMSFDGTDGNHVFSSEKNIGTDITKPSRIDINSRSRTIKSSNKKKNKTVAGTFPSYDELWDNLDKKSTVIYNSSSTLNYSAAANAYDETPIMGSVKKTFKKQRSSHLGNRATKFDNFI